VRGSVLTHATLVALTAGEQTLPSLPHLEAGRQKVGDMHVSHTDKHSSAASKQG
jgi:hypothetical protein